MFTCLFCSKSFDCDDSMKQHIKEIHYIKKIRQEIEELENENESLKIEN